MHILYPITQRIDNTSECPIDMSEVGNRSCYHEVFGSHISLTGLLRFTRNDWDSEHRIKQSSCIFSSILTIRIATTLTIVADLGSVSKVCERICDDHRCSSSRGQEPDATCGIEYSEFETCSCFRVEFFDIFFSVGFLRTKRMWKSETCPMSSLAELLTIVNSGHHVETHYRSIRRKSERINLKIGKSVLFEK